jgi:acetoacetyl-CoA synthetase
MKARATSQRTDFVRFCEKRTGRRFTDHAAFHAFSVAEYRQFWLLFLEWSDLIYEGTAEPVCTDDSCERATFFPGVRLSYAENLLRFDTPGEGERLALVAHRVDGHVERLTRRELRRRVRVLAAELAQLGVSPGERVVAVASNNPEAIVGALAAATIGATFSIATPDMGVPALLSRFEQLAPVVLMANLEDRAETGSSTLHDHVGALAGALPTLKLIVALDDGAAPAGIGVPLLRLSDVLAADDDEREWPRFDFNHPLFVLFTSGTTGRPKCIVHGAGGTLLEHAKEHRLHVDLRPADTLFFHTSTAWMMWNWQLSALACGSPIVLFEGSFTEPRTLWELVEVNDVSVFGASPPYLQLCQDSGASPASSLGLGALRSVLSTGSILHDWQYDWVRDHVGPVALQSISGGSDIIGCFVLGNPDLPVRRGMIQCASLGLDVAAVTAPGESVGELICRNPFPSRPLGFVGDDGTKFHSTYFERNPGVWTHGDLIEFDADGYARMHGRSDGVLKVQGVRIGPAEIQIALREVAEVSDVLAVQQQTPGVRGASRVVLLVVLREGATLDGSLVLRIRREIARCATPLHVPELVVQVDELPTTHSGKRSERAARDAVDGIPAGNVEALRNPGSLDQIRRAVAETEQRLRALAETPEDAAKQPTEARLRAIWESVLGVASLGPDDNFFDVGGSSLAAVRVFELIYERLGEDLPLSTLLHAPTTNALAALIDGPDQLRVPSIVPLVPGTAGGRPLFMLPGWHGDVLRLRALALRLATDRPVHGVQGGLSDPSLPPGRRMEALADRYLEAIRSVQPAGPYALVGHSFGGFLAFDIARRLDALHERVELLGIIDTAVHYRWLTPRDRAGFLIMRPFRYARTVLRSPRTVLAPYLRRIAARVGLREPEPITPLLMRERAATGWEAWAAYRPQAYAGTVTLFRAEERDGTLADALTIWREVARGGLVVEEVRGGHNEMLIEPNVEVLAERLSARLTDDAVVVREDQLPALRSAEMSRRTATTV